MVVELAEYIEDGLSAYAVDSNLFAYAAPPDYEGLCIVVEQPSPGHRNPMIGLLDFGTTPIRVQVRGAVGGAEVTVMAEADSVHALLHGSTQVRLPQVGSGPQYLVNISAYDPYYAGRDERRRPVATINMDVRKQEE